MSILTAATIAHGDTLALRNISVSATISPAISRSQTIKLEPSRVVEPIVVALGAAGYPTASGGNDLQLTAHVTAYDSGSYLGFAKTASIAVDFELADAQGETISAWHSDCKHRVDFNMHSTATRNAEAVNVCLDQVAHDAVAGIADAP